MAGLMLVFGMNIQVTPPLPPQVEMVRKIEVEDENDEPKDGAPDEPPNDRRTLKNRLPPHSRLRTSV